MSFIKDVTIYKRGKVHVYINQCHNKGKTNLFAVRRDDKTGYACLLGLIKYDGAWRQYIFLPDENTKWSDSCLINISNFCGLQTKKLRVKWKTKLKVESRK